MAQRGPVRVAFDHPSVASSEGGPGSILGALITCTHAQAHTDGIPRQRPQKKGSGTSFVETDRHTPTLHAAQ
jgi:hypothetical protein